MEIKNQEDLVSVLKNLILNIVLSTVFCSFMNLITVVAPPLRDFEQTT